MSQPDGFSAVLRFLGIGSSPELDRLLEHAPFGLYLDTVSAGCIYVNQAFATMFGLTRDGCLGFSWAKVVDADDVATLQADIGRFNTTREPAAPEPDRVGPRDDGRGSLLAATPALCRTSIAAGAP